ncbi:NACHT domain-containing protein [Kitasatospora sp. NPDC088391]|uniref:NACHT domain-containing protein n=1 Tax=Kitasatospora sp. NPDC088391 TaxID=3364074 RepID=UPI0037F87981
MSELTGRYHYERLMEKPFQQLCNALLAQSFPDIQCFPVGHRDGGRDAVLPVEGRQAVIFQVKWTSKPSKDPVAWLTQTVKDEADNIQRLVAQGAKEYFLLTSLAGTAVPKSGSMDRMEIELAKYSREFGIPMKVWWRADIDARVDAAPDALKWAYSDMLVGHDLVRYLIDGASAAARDHELRNLVVKVIATQWEEDAKVKFKQAELTSHDLTDLFIDVEAVRTSQALSTRGLQMAELGQENLGGAARYLLSAKQPFTLVKGEPGQGKSTLGQYLCQIHRAAFLKERVRDAAGLPAAQAPRVPLRVDLRDYAAWMDGGDPLEEHLSSTRKTPRRKASLEDFLAYVLRSRSGGLPADVATVDGITQRLPVLIVLDGLDEVARPDMRALVVKHIDEFTARLQHSLLAPQVIVTTRPNAATLAEPSHRMYETIALSHLKPALRTAYLRKWAAARSVTGRDRRELQRVFDQRSAEPHIAQLANNPMQLTILLYLMHKRGNSVPTGRTELYTSYMETFLDREAEKSPQVEEHRRDLEEVTAYLGWLLQAEAEGSSGSGRIGLKDLERSILTYLFEADKNTHLVAALFTAVTDRVWALTSKIQGTFEFDVQPLREYFAARYLYEYAGAERGDFDTSRVLQHLVRRPYWMNVARFYAGFARANELAGLVEALEEEQESRQQPLEMLTAAWMLLADGVFSKRPRAQQRAAELFLDDLSVCLLAYQIRYHHDLPDLPLHHGGRELAAALLAAVEHSPSSATAHDRVRVSARLLREPGEFGAWWNARLHTAANTPDERIWLALGAGVGAGEHVRPEDVAPMALTDAASAADAVRAGLTPPHGSAMEERMVRAVLDGHCFDASPLGKGYPADLLRVLAPQEFLNKVLATDKFMFRLPGIHADTRISGSQRQAAWKRLVRRDPRLGTLQQAVKAGLGERRTTAVWSNTAQAISAIFGPCWAAAVTTVIGAASPADTFVTGGAMTSGSQPLGPAADYGRLLQEIRRYRLEAAWWNRQYEEHTDPLSRATWALALTTAAAPSVIASLLDHLNTAVSALPDDTLHALLTSASRLSLSEAVGRALPFKHLRLDENMSAPTALLLSCHSSNAAATALEKLTDEELGATGRYGTAAWPAATVLTNRILHASSASALEALRAHPTHSLAQVPLHDLPVGQTASNLFHQIVNRPADYPRGWVWAAQEALAHPWTEGMGGASHPYLSDVADQERWFGAD